MSFRIHAAGTNGFRYTSDNCPDGDIFQAASIYSAVGAGSPDRMGVATGLADYYQPSVSAPDMTRAVAGMTFVWEVSRNVSALALYQNAQNGSIAISAQLSHLLGNNVFGFARYEFRPVENPGAEFFRTVTPALVSTEMNNYGVLREMSLALTRYESVLNDRDIPMLLVQLSK